MIIPSIDLQSGKAVQLIGGKEFAVDGGDPLNWASEFGIAGEIGVIDLDAALGTGNNRESIVGILRDHQCRVGGGIRTIEDAMFYLDHGALQVIIGTKATPEFCSQLPRARVMAALDTYHGEVVVEGWQTNTKKPIEERIAELKDHVGGFLVTFVEREGRMVTMDMDRCRALKELCGDVPLTVAGGLSTVEEVAELDAMGIDVQVGMALYTRKIDYIDCVLSPLRRRLPDQLWPTVVADEQGRALGLVWSSEESVRLAAKERRGIYYSRSRQEIWRKGETSGAVQELLRIDLDCDRDALRFTVRQSGTGFCHKQTESCWGDLGGFGTLQATLIDRKADAPTGSYSARLFAEEGLLESKLKEEAKELTEATERSHIIAEAADLFYFATTKLVKSGISLVEVERELDRRSKKVTRRGGDRKS
ncbi:MAG: phosphoribosyl-ATP diphosphatase [Armatimonadetes bacterium Cent15-Ar3]|nr:MAG: phosphoribosyl-ATP diphosphatase [Armatimonadetes bacterium Cent15-Ar3]